MLNYEELTLPELKREAKKLGVEIDKKDTKNILIEKIKEKLTKEVKRESKLLDVRQRMNKTKKVIVTKLNPDDIVRDSILVTITNATGSYTCAVPFNVEVELPEPIIKNLKNKKYQGWQTTRHPLLGNVDTPVMLPEFSVQEISK
jgi:hypothetical protein